MQSVDNSNLENKNNTNMNTKKFTKLFTEETNENGYMEEGQTFEEMFQDSIGQEDSAFKEGQVVEGKIVSVSNEHVMVDIGHKSEGLIPLEEFSVPKEELSVGQVISVLLEKFESKNGSLKLSKQKADAFKVWDEISEVCSKGEVLEGNVLSVVRGGLSVDIGVKAFLPGSQIDTRPIRDLEQFVGKTLQFKVIKFNKKRGNIVLSRRAVMDEERNRMKGATLSQLKVGSLVQGKIKNITDYGAFVDLGGIDGLLHITDMSWGRIKHPSEVIEVGQDVNVRILKYDQEKERVSLGLKQTLADPWLDIHERFLPGQRVSGKVVSITDYGAFVEIENGVEGLIHVSEMSWTQRIKDPKQLLTAGQEVESVILDIDLESKRLSLGLKQIAPNPWESLDLKYPAGTRVKGKIKNITDFGLFIEIEEGIDGLVHVSDISWEEKVESPAEKYKNGEELEAVVLNIDKASERVSLSIKLLSGDPWQEFSATNKTGNQVVGTVTKLTSFGAFVELSKNIEGMIHVSELSEERIAHPEAVVKVGDSLTAEIINIDERSRKISLSVKAMAKREEREAIESFNNEDSGSSSFGDSLSPDMAAKLGMFSSGSDAPQSKEAEATPAEEAQAEDTKSENENN